MADTRILVGLLAILIAVSGVVYIGIGERDRQVEYAGQYHARSVQNGGSKSTAAPATGFEGRALRE
jgi:hypothetical protein